MSIHVVVNGAQGKMGRTTCQAILDADGLSLVAELDKNDNLSAILDAHTVDVVIDFTHPSCVKANVQTALAGGAHVIVGTTGLSQDDLTALNTQATAAKRAVFVCPNFSIGAIMMMKAAQLIATHMPHVEIIETHHEQKADAPSGTAIKTAELISEANPKINAHLANMDETELVPGARGGQVGAIPIHSVRLPGHVAHQDVVFSSVGQCLRLRHDSFSRDSFMPGVVLCVREIVSRTGLTYGLENII